MGLGDGEYWESVLSSPDSIAGDAIRWVAVVAIGSKTPPESIAGDAIRWGAVLIGAIVVLGTVVWLARRWLLSGPAPSGDTVWSLQHLRELKAQGRITEEEFQSLKAKVIAAAGATSRQTKKPSSAASAPARPDGRK